MTNRCFLRCPVWEQATHHFPNQKKQLDRFKAWVEAIDRKLETAEDYEYFRTKRLCHIHFIPMYCYNDHRLSPIAIPTLYLTKKSRNEYWAKDLALRKLQSKSPVEDAELARYMFEAQKDEAVTNNKEPMVEVLEEEIPYNNTQDILGSDVQESLVNILIEDTVKDENYTDVHEQPKLELSVQSPVKSNVPKPVANIIIEYVQTTDEVSVQKILMKNIPRDITSEVENVRPVPDFIHDTSEEVENVPDFIHNISVDSTVFQTCAEEIQINCGSVKNCIQRQKKRRKSKYHGLSWEAPERISMEHNYSKASIVSPMSHISSNGVHPKKTIITLKSTVKELQKQLKYYKKKCKVLLNMNKDRVNSVTLPRKQIRCKQITKLSQKGPSSHQRAIKKIINYLKNKNVACGVSLPRNV